MIWASAKNKQGFTIVELLIVVVVIAILATITVVAFTGVQNRAKNQQTVSAVRTYYAALASYGVKNSGLPSARACLGPSSFYDSNPCYVGGSTYNWSDTLNTALAEIINGQPATAAGVVSGSGITASGIFYDNQSGSGGSGYIGFPIFGESTCPTIAGAELYGSTSMGSNIYCRIKNPTY